MMKAALNRPTENQNPAQSAQALRNCCLITDGNAHRNPSQAAGEGLDETDVLHEAMLPEIRTAAILIAAMRHDFSRHSPSEFTDEADWFAARIIVLQARRFYLDISMSFMLQTANERARQFASRHRLPFQAASICPSLHCKRPEHILQMECLLGGDVLDDPRANTQALRPALHKFA